MWKQVGRKDSDDEFEDALSEAPVPTVDASASGTAGVSGDKSSETAATKINKTHEELVEEITRQQEDLKIPDEAEEEAVATGGTDTEPGGEQLDAEVAEDDVDEEGLRERDKLLTEAELNHNKEEADRMKLEGNELFKNNEAERAIQVYTEALRICPTTQAKERAILYGNRAAAKIKLDLKKSAIEDCSKAITLWPEYVRALLRRAKLYEIEDTLDEALEDYKRVYELDPGQREAHEAMVRLPPLINERNERMKTEMMSKLKDLGNMILKPFGLSTENFQMQQDPNTGSYSINFNQGSR